MADNEEICSRVNNLNLDETTDENNNSNENDPEQDDEIQDKSEESGEKEEDSDTEEETREDAANAQLEKDEVDGPQIEKLTVEPQDESAKSDMAKEITKKTVTKFKQQSLGAAQGGTTFAPQSFIDVPDYGYSIDGGFPDAW